MGHGLGFMGPRFPLVVAATMMMTIIGPSKKTADLNMIGMRVIRGLFFGSFVFLSGCSGLTMAGVSPLSTQKYEPKAKDTEIKISTGDLSRKYEEIAVINIRSSAWTQIDRLNWKLKIKARELGADAVIRVSYGHEGMWGNPTATGTAIRFVE